MGLSLLKSGRALVRVAGRRALALATAACRALCCGQGPLVYAAVECCTGAVTFYVTIAAMQQCDSHVTNPDPPILAYFVIGNVCYAARTDNAVFPALTTAQALAAGFQILDAPQVQCGTGCDGPPCRPCPQNCCYLGLIVGACNSDAYDNTNPNQVIRCCNLGSRVQVQVSASDEYREWTAFCLSDSVCGFVCSPLLETNHWIYNYTGVCFEDYCHVFNAVASSSLYTFTQYPGTSYNGGQPSCTLVNCQMVCTGTPYDGFTQTLDSLPPCPNFSANTNAPEFAQLPQPGSFFQIPVPAYLLANVNPCNYDVKQGSIGPDGSGELDEWVYQASADCNGTRWSGTATRLSYINFILTFKAVETISGTATIEVLGNQDCQGDPCQSIPPGPAPTFGPRVGVGAVVSAAPAAMLTPRKALGL